MFPLISAVDAGDKTVNRNRKRKAPELELESPGDAYEQKENTDVELSQSNKRRHTEEASSSAPRNPLLSTPEDDLWEFQKMFRHEGLLQTQLLSPKIRSVISRTDQSGLFMLSPTGKLEKVPSRSATGGGHFRFTAKELRSSGGVQRKRVRLQTGRTRARGKGDRLFRARQLSNVLASDSTIRDCTAVELEEHSKKQQQQILNLSASNNTTSLSTTGQGGLGSFTAPTPLQGTTNKASTPLLSESQSIIGGAIAEATKQSKQLSDSSEKQKKSSSISDQNPVATVPSVTAGANAPVPSLSQAQPPLKFQFGSTTTGPMPNFQSQSHNAGSQPTPATGGSAPSIPNFNAPAVGGFSLGTAGAAPRVGAKSASSRRKGRRKR